MDSNSCVVVNKKSNIAVALRSKKSIEICVRKRAMVWQRGPSSSSYLLHLGIISTEKEKESACQRLQSRLVVLVGSPLHGAELAHAHLHATRSSLQKHVRCNESWSPFRHSSALLNLGIDFCQGELYQHIWVHFKIGTKS